MSEDEDEQEEQLLLVAGMNCGYANLLECVKQLQFGAADRRLPRELSKRVASYFLVEKVAMTNVQCTGCSSKLEAEMDPSSSLSEDESTWWLSAIGSMPSGMGSEWIEYKLNPKAKSAVRLTEISLKIPPLPHGPLSVKRFRVQGASPDGDSSIWHVISPTFEVHNVAGWQRYELSADVSKLRLVCLSNQMSAFTSPVTPNAYSSVGFYSVKFE